MAIAYIVVAVGFILMFWIAFSENGADSVIGEGWRVRNSPVKFPELKS